MVKWKEWLNKGEGIWVAGLNQVGAADFLKDQWSLIFAPSLLRKSNKSSCCNNQAVVTLKLKTISLTNFI